VGNINLSGLESPSHITEDRKMSYAHTGAEEGLLWLTIGDTLKETVAKYPENDAIVALSRNERYSYKRFYEMCCQTAKAFMKLGIAKGDKVAIWATNYPEWTITQFATAMIGAILVPVNPAFREYELEYVLKDSESQTLILIPNFKTSNYLEMFYSLCPEAKESGYGGIKSSKLPNLRNVILLNDEVQPGMLLWKELLKSGDEVSDKELEKRALSPEPDDVIMIQYTSGTTGFPKGASLTHHNIVNNGLFIGRNMNFTSKDRVCIPVPFYHCFGTVLSNMVCVVYGATMVLPGEYFEPLATLRAVEQERCTALYGVPTMYIAELDHPDFKNFDLSSLRTGIMAGSSCPVELMRKVIDLMGMREITICYGLTECSPVINQTKTDDPLDLRVETVGAPLPYTEIKIIDPSTGKTVPIGVQGEICCRGYSVMRGYYKKSAETAEAIDEKGWLHTGDLGVMDENGYCRITGRIKEMIIRGGENIYPREIEEVLHTHPMVKDVYVFGVPDRKYGEEIAAWIQLKEGDTAMPEEFQEFCVGKISHQKVPRYIKFVDSFPMTVTGKIQKFVMRETAIEDWVLE
jgi:fatty-acyl-CoA synthase